MRAAPAGRSVGRSAIAARRHQGWRAGTSGSDDPQPRGRRYSLRPASPAPDAPRVAWVPIGSLGADPASALFYTQAFSTTGRRSRPGRGPADILGRLVVEQTGTAAFMLPTLERDRGPGRARCPDGSTSTLARRWTPRSPPVRSAPATRPPSGEAVAVARWSASGDAGSRGAVPPRPPRLTALVAAALGLNGLALPTKRDLKVDTR